MATSRVDYLTFFKPYLKRWVEKTMGPKPTEAELLTGWCWGVTRPGVEALATAMARRAGGYTVAQYLIASGAAGAAHNKQRLYRDRKLASYAGTGGVDGHPNARVFTLTPSKAGLALLDKRMAEPADAPAPAAKGKGKPKGKAKRVKPVKVTPAENTAPEATPVAADAPVADAPVSEPVALIAG